MPGEGRRWLGWGCSRPMSHPRGGCAPSGSVPPHLEPCHQLPQHGNMDKRALLPRKLSHGHQAPTTGDSAGFNSGTLKFPRVGLRADIETKDKPHSWTECPWWWGGADDDVPAAGKLGWLPGTCGGKGPHICPALLGEHRARLTTVVGRATEHGWAPTGKASGLGRFVGGDCPKPPRGAAGSIQERLEPFWSCFENIIKKPLPVPSPGWWLFGAVLEDTRLISGDAQWLGREDRRLAGDRGWPSRPVSRGGWCGPRQGSGLTLTCPPGPSRPELGVGRNGAGGRVFVKLGTRRCCRGRRQGTISELPALFWIVKLSGLPCHRPPDPTRPAPGFTIRSVPWTGLKLCPSLSAGPWGTRRTQPRGTWDGWLGFILRCSHVSWNCEHLLTLKIQPASYACVLGSRPAGGASAPRGLFWLYPGAGFLAEGDTMQPARLWTSLL